MHRTTRSRRTSEAGFSLIEILVSLGIIAMLAGFVGPQVIGYFGRAKVQTAAAQIKGVRAALDLYQLDMGRYPTLNEGLAALVSNPGGDPFWRGPYLQDGVTPVDPWGAPYRYGFSTDGRVSVTSLGSDGAEGGEGDAADLGV
ncbi:MAG: type II secretion system major pseudopilin GspG [Pseudomonadota bacterium]